AIAPTAAAAPFFAIPFRRAATIHSAALGTPVIVPILTPAASFPAPLRPAPVAAMAAAPFLLTVLFITPRVVCVAAGRFAVATTVPFPVVTICHLASLLPITLGRAPKGQCALANGRVRVRLWLHFGYSNCRRRFSKASF